MIFLWKKEKMKQIMPKTLEEGMNLIFEVLIQGDTRYYDFEAQRILIWFLVGQGISLEERDLPAIPAPKEEDFQFYGANIQREEKYIARFLLFNQTGFKK